MAFTMFQSNAHYSLIIKDHVIRFVELRKPVPNGVRHFLEQPIPQGVIENGHIMRKKELETLLKNCIKDWHLRGKKIFITVPNSVSVVRKLDLPGHLTINEIRPYLFMEIGQSIHLPFDNPVFDTHLIENSQDITQLLLFAAPENVVRSYVDLLEDCGTKPVAAEISPLSLHRLYKKLDLSTEQNTMFLQFDEDGTNVSIFNRDLLLFIRQVANDYNEDLLLETEERFTLIFSEIDRIMNFYEFTINNGLAGVQKIVLTGDHPDIQSFFTSLERTVHIPVYPLFNEKISSLTNQLLPSGYQVNIGLALKEEVKR
ncbi:pilus assembly protein PilM [Pullulanibacillus sp. KACC 23026]|uniref:type IV pilus biogenesis protein PilM n=1 Tax=Pullulanibacillus sp. KACC 23026 TaxID=3028315 RepID=UPI0023AFF062|nr:pilus assembly protein PilM [Pullulanibacillus sp. KACC 23026]WEG11463.1 pilus assembly protein PilM [Pullulanibacillus sp. KACC 23026]